jgi:hypothetical protein
VSYGVHAFAVDFGELKAALGSGDGQLLARLLADFAAEVARLDRDDEEEGRPPTAEVLRHLIFGGPYDGSVGFKYGYALEFLCWHLGEFLNNSEWSGMRGEWFDEVDGALKRAGVPTAAFTTLRLTTRGAPVPIPEPDDFPGIGHLTSEEVPAAAAALDAADLGAMSEDVRNAVAQVREWLGACEEFGRGLVCFYA